MCIYTYILHNMEPLIELKKYRYWESSECRKPRYSSGGPFWARIP